MNNVASDPLFGIGLCAGGCGLELGLKIALPGYRAIALVERESSVAGRMAARMQEGSLPFAPIWDDVSTFDGRKFRGLVSIVSAGFPCQPFSVAGKRRGTGDERWIWPDIARIIQEVAPEIVFLENVPGLLLDPYSDIDRWNMEEQPDDSLGGMGTVLRDLAGLGFDVEWTSVRASDIGASHGRKRVFILGYRMAHAASLFAKLDARQWARSSDSDSARSRGQFAGSDVSMVNAELPERRPGPLGSGCDSAGIDGQGETSSRVGNGIPVLADSASSGPSIRRNNIGIRERAAAERTSSELGDSERSRAEFCAAGSGPRDSVSEPSGDVAHSARTGEHRQNGESGRGRGRGICAPGEQLGTEIGPFAYGPSDPRWENLLVSRPWLRPSWSQAEAESTLRPLADELADLLVNDRTSALRTLGNGVVPLQAAWAFITLARRAGLICRLEKSGSGSELTHYQKSRSAKVLPIP